jgi:hypothetical protein
MIRNITGITDPKELLEIKRSLHTTKSNLKNQGVTGKSHSKLCPNGDFWVEFKQGRKIVTTI